MTYLSFLNYYPLPYNIANLKNNSLVHQKIKKFAIFLQNYRKECMIRLKNLCILHAYLNKSVLKGELNSFAFAIIR